MEVGEYVDNIRYLGNKHTYGISSRTFLRQFIPLDQ